MWLDELWFAIFVVIVAGYLVLDGFDLGVGMLHPFLAGDDTERRLVLNSIGPILTRARKRLRKQVGTVAPDKPRHAKRS